MSKHSLINTINRGVDGAVEFFSRSECRDPEMLRMSYMYGMVSVFVGLMGTDLILSNLGGSFDKDGDLDDLDEEKDQWHLAALMAAAYLGRVGDMKELIA